MNVLKSLLKTAALAVCGSLLTGASLRADVSLPAIFGDHMVLQREMECKVWGWGAPGEKVTVSINGQSHDAVADGDGNWSLKLDPMKAGGPHQLVVKGNNTLTLRDVLVGEVWICSGQSNMAFAVQNANDGDLESLTANYPRIRLISVPQVGTQERQKNFKGQWDICSPETVKQFSAVGYFFGREVHNATGIPIGLIDNAWGGSSAEAWVRRDVLEADPRMKGLMSRWEQTEASYDWDKIYAQYENRLAKWRDAVAEAKAAGKPLPQRPRAPRNQMTGNHRPANIYNGVLAPTIGYGIRGVVWYQGESNASRAYQYRDLFPLMIQHWRDEWGQGNFPFYWVQLADFRAESPEPQESTWAELREAQTMTMSKLDHTGQAVIYDLGEADDIHPRDKQNVGKRLSRWALANEYGIDVPYRSPQYASMEKQGSHVTVTFDYAGGGMDWFDTRQLKGFAVAGEDRKFYWADAKIVAKDKIEVWCDAVADPVSVRYAWADNPVANVQNVHGLKLTPFRTDDWPGVTAGAE